MFNEKIYMFNGKNIRSTKIYTFNDIKYICSKKIFIFN